MKRANHRIFGILGAFALCLALTGPALSAEPAYLDTPAYQMIGQAVDQLVINDLTARFGEDFAQSCIQTRELSLCIDPSASPEQIEEALRLLPTYTGDRFMPGARWTSTATNPTTGSWGDPITLTYSFIPDGTYIPSGAGEPGGPSTLYAEMNGHFGSPAVWKPFFAEHFDAWGSHIGVTYVEVADDGAPFPNSPGILGTRGDCRIGAHYIQNPILAYNYFPPGGDMVVNDNQNWSNASNDYRFFRNVIAHEHGHGLGLNHETPNSCTKLMESALCTNFTYPQDDDIRGGMNPYGDFLENDDDASEANELGAFTGTLPIETPSLDHDTDVDWFHFTVTGESRLSVTVHPVGSAYQIHGLVVFTHKMQDLSFKLRNGANGANVILTVDDTIEGVDEVLTDYVLNPGSYWIEVDGVSAAVGLVVQRYNITFDLQLDDLTAVDDSGVPASGMGLQTYPNPFNPKTTARFYAPAAGDVQLNVYNVAGSLIRSYESTAASEGWMEVSWNGIDNQGSSVSSGIYFLQAQAGGRSETVRAVLLK